jgi:hypothetical protein
MLNTSIDTPQALDAAIAASRQARRDKLLRAVRNQRIRTRVAFALGGSVALCSLGAFFFADDPEAAIVCAVIACITVGFTYVAGKVGRKEALDSLQEMDQSN